MKRARKRKEKNLKNLARARTRASDIIIIQHCLFLLFNLILNVRK